MKKRVVSIFALLFSLTATADPLKQGETYRLEKTIHNLVRTHDSQAGFVAARNSTFIVVDDKAAANAYIVRFITLFSFSGKASTVRKDEEYLLPKQVGGTVIENSATPSLVGLVSGPLVVPFKYRITDKVLSGEASVGYYVGYRWEAQIPFTDQRLPISPIVGGGVAPINIGDASDPSNVLAVSFATGLLVENWSNVNVGLVIGRDLVEQADWPHQWETWVSVMIGWDL